MASIRNTGAAGSGTTTASIPVPTGTLIQTGDALYMVVEAMATTPNADPLTTPAGWTKLAVMNSGTPASTDTTLAVFGKIAGASEAAVTVTGTGLDHVVGRMCAVYGHALSVITDTVVGADNSATTGATATALGITVVDNSLVSICASTGRDLASTTNFSGWANTNLVATLASPSLPQENMDTGVIAGTGGGVGMAWGTCLGTSTGNSTVTIASSTDPWCAVHLGIPTHADYAPGEAIVSWPTSSGGHYMMAGFKALTPGVPIVEVKKAHAMTSTSATTLTATWDGGGTATTGNLLVALVTPCQSNDISPAWTGSANNGSGRGAILTKTSDGTETGATITLGVAGQYSIALFELANAAAFDVQARSNITAVTTTNFGTPGRTAVDEWIGATVGLGTAQGGALFTWDPTFGFTEYYEDTRSVAASKIVPGTPTGQPTLVHIDGYEHQSTSILRFGGANNTGVWTTVGTAGGISFPAGRTGGVCLRVAPSATTTNAYREVGAAGTGHRIGSIYFRINQAPTGTVDHIIDLDISPSGCGFRINNNGTIEATALGVGAVAGPVVTDNAWHLLDFYVNTSANPWVVKWTVDGVAMTDKTSTSQAASTVATKFGIGFLLNQNNGMTLDFDDFVYSNIPADYPIGPHKVLAVVPTGDGTHAAGTNVIEDNAGTDLVSPNGFGLVDDWPAVTTPYIQQVAVGASNYAEVTFPDTSETTVWGAQAFAALFANSTTASATATTQIVDSVNARLLDLYSGDMSETALHYRAAIIPSISTVAKLNGLKARAGFAAVVTSVPRWSALMIEYAVPEVATTPINASDSGSAADTAVLTKPIIQVQVHHQAASVSPIVDTFSAAPTVGNIVGAIITTTTAATAGISAPAGYSVARLENQAAIFYKVSDGTETSISVAWSNGTSALRMNHFELSNVEPSSPLDSTGYAVFAAATSATPATDAVAAFADEYAIAQAGQDGGNGGGETASNSYTVMSTGNVRDVAASRTYLGNQGGAVTTTLGWTTSNSGRWIIASFKPLGAINTTPSASDTGTAVDTAVVTGAGIQFGAESLMLGVGSAGRTGDFSWTHTPTGTPRGATLIIVAVEAADTGTTVTYGGVPMVEVTGQTNDSPQIRVADSIAIYIYHLGTSIPTGAQTVAVNRNGAGGLWMAAAFTQTADLDTEVEEAAWSSGTGANASINLAIPAGVPTFIAGGLGSATASTGNISPGTGLSIMAGESDFGVQVGGIYRAVIQTGGTFTADVTSTATGRALYAVAIREVVTTTPVNVTDSATGADTSALTAALSVADTATATDTAPILGMTVADAAVGADASALATALVATDAATAADAVTQRFIASTDAAVATDTAALLAGNLLTANDSATSTDVLTGRALALGDSATAVDTTTVDTGLVDGFEDESFQTNAFQSRPSVAGLANIVSTLGALTQAATATTNIGVFASDTATASDLVTAVSRPVTDAATAADTAPTLGKTVIDSATGADVVSDLDKVASDSATGADAALTTAALPVTDSATGVESIPTLAKATTDAATATDAAALTTTIAASDSGVAVDTSVVPDAALPLFDSATAVDTALLTNVPQNLIAVAVSTNEIDLTWDVFSGATAYDIERDGAIIAFDVPTNAYDDLGLSPDTLYVYRVRAVL